MVTHTKRKNHIRQLTLQMEDVWFNIEKRQKHYDNPLKPGWTLVTLCKYTMMPLPVLDNPFSEEEIKFPLNDMLIDHAPGPDGFNEVFMKMCQDIIQSDFNRLFVQFSNGVLNLEHINGSIITLIPTKDNPMIVNDYQPISLWNS
jgi:hypothetical protein